MRPSAQRPSFASQEGKASAPSARRDDLRRIPSVDSLLHHPALKESPAEQAKAAVRTALDEARGKLSVGEPVEIAPEQLAARALALISERRQTSLRPAINATGIVIHTGLGRAPLSKSAQAAVVQVAGGACILETDAESGQRLSRHRHLAPLLRELTGAEAGFAVNNNAAAVLLAVSALAAGKEVIISRGQLVEIGGSFRLPEVIAESGAKLVEVGTTNRTYASDYERAITEQTGALLWVHASNYRISGYVASPNLEELAALAAAHSLPLIADLGSGAFVDLARLGLGGEPLVQEAIAAGADIVTFSGDKLLGGPQAGLIVGKAGAVERTRSHPLARAVRIGKLDLAALSATLLAYRDPVTVWEELPVLAMLARPREELAAFADQLASSVAPVLAGIAEVEVTEGSSQVGGGALPTENLSSVLLRLKPCTCSAETLALALRGSSPAVFGKIQRDGVELDLRTVLPEQRQALQAILLSLPERLRDE